MTVDFHALTEHLERVYTRRLALRPVSLADAWPLFEATRNPLFNQGLLWDQPSHDAPVLERLDAIVEAARRGRLCAVSAVLRATGEWVSLFRFQPHASEPELLEMGVWTHDRFWQDHYTVELAHAVIDAAFETFDVDVLIGAASPANRGSCKLMGLAGMVPTTRVMRRHESKADVLLQEFEITRAAWQAARRELRFSFVPIRAGSPLAAPRAATFERGRPAPRVPGSVRPGAAGRLEGRGRGRAAAHKVVPVDQLALPFAA